MLELGKCNRLCLVIHANTVIFLAGMYSVWDELVLSNAENFIFMGSPLAFIQMLIPEEFAHGH